MSADPFEHLNARQREAATAPHGPLLITAGAGSGKTRTLTSRLIHFLNEGIPGHEIVAITFTNKAAGEIRSRVLAHLASQKDETGQAARDRSLPFLGTFHSFCARILRQEARLVGRTPSFSIFDESDAERAMKQTLEALDIGKEKCSPGLARYKVSQVKNELCAPEEVDDSELFARIFDGYEKLLAEQNAFDFDDLIEKVVSMLRSREEVRKRYAERHRYLLVDEYQDINAAQYELVKLLARDHGNVSVVGDDQQSIYGFRWSDFRNFLNFERDWRGARVVVLDQNYRSSGTIVRAASGLIAKNTFQRAKNLWTENPPGDPIEIIECADNEDEALWIAEKCAKSGPEKSAVLYRTNAQSRPIEQALISSGISYEVYGGLKFYERREVKDVVAALRYAANPKDAVSRERIEGTFVKAVREELVAKLPELGARFSPLELVGYFLKTANYEAYLKRTFKDAAERLENVAEIASFAAGFETLADLLERVSLFQSADAARGGKLDRPGAKLMTIHLSKGLEFENVHIAGVSEGLLPHERSLGSKSELEEERRLAYVAMTRAMRRLSISFCRLASRFLYELPPELVVFKGTEAMTWRPIRPPRRFGGRGGDEFDE